MEALTAIITGMKAWAIFTCCVNTMTWQLQVAANDKIHGRRNWHEVLVNSKDLTFAMCISTDRAYCIITEVTTVVFGCDCDA